MRIARTPQAAQQETAESRNSGRKTSNDRQASGDTHKAVIHIEDDGFRVESEKGWLIVAMTAIQCLTFLLAIALMKLL